MNVWQTRELSTVDRFNSGRGSAIDLSPSAIDLPTSAKTCHDLPATATSQGVVHRSGSSEVDAYRSRPGCNRGTADTAQFTQHRVESSFPFECPDDTQQLSATAVKQRCVTTKWRRRRTKYQPTQPSLAFRFGQRWMDHRTLNWDRPPAMSRTWGGLEGLVHLSPSATSFRRTLKTWPADLDQDLWILGQRCWTSQREPS